VPDLTNALPEEWSKILINITLLKLVESLPRREAVIAAKGGRQLHIKLNRSGRRTKTFANIVYVLLLYSTNMQLLRVDHVQSCPFKILPQWQAILQL